MTNNIIEKINNRIDEILTSREAELAALNKKLQAAQEAAADVHGRVEAAVSSTDTKAYQAAKQEEAKTMDLIELYTERMSQLKSGDLVSKAEDAVTVKGIQEYQEQLEREASEKIIALLSQVEQIGREYYAAQDEANKAVNRWRSEVRSNGMVDCRNKPHRFKDSELRCCVSAITTNYYYRKQLGVPRYPGFGSIWTK